MTDYMPAPFRIRGEIVAWICCAGEAVTIETKGQHISAANAELLGSWLKRAHAWIAREVEARRERG